MAGNEFDHTHWSDGHFDFFEQLQFIIHTKTQRAVYYKHSHLVGSGW